VWKAEWNEMAVAVKILMQGVFETDPKSVAEFNNEVALLKSIRHQNVVLFFGAGKMDDGIPFLV